MDRDLYRADRAFSAARSSLRKTLGIATAGDVEQCYLLLRLEYDLLSQLMAQIDFEIIATKWAFIKAQQVQKLRNEEASVEALLKNWCELLSSSQEHLDLVLKTSLGHASKAVPQETYGWLLAPSISKMNQHRDVVRAYIRSIHLLVDTTVARSMEVERLLNELDVQASLTHRYLEHLKLEAEMVSRPRVEKEHEQSKTQTAVVAEQAPRNLPPIENANRSHNAEQQDDDLQSEDEFVFD